MREYVVAVDIGTGSARAGIFDRKGKLLARADRPIAMNRPEENHAEQDSEDIWAAVCGAVKAARDKAGVAADNVAAIGFDATCSLVVRDRDGAPLSVNRAGDARWDTIVWLDHRALKEADFCTSTEHPVLHHSGRVMSPEMEMPKLMWLKQNLPGQWERAGYFFDLADYMSWRATGSTARSRCTLTAKWNYLAHKERGWQADYLEEIGLADLLGRGGLPEETLPIGSAVGTLTATAAGELGLDTECRVAPGLIDAYAGALGVLGRFAAEPANLERQLALIAGTSSCIVAFSREMKPGFGMWGPYFEAVFPGCWLVEGGQSATGALLDHIVRVHGGGREPTAETHMKIIQRVQELRALHGPAFADRLHVLPDFHGNRSPLADPHALGVISGLALDSSFDALCRLYWRACVAIALGIRHILEMMKEAGYNLDTLHVTGGHVRNPLLMELYCDATGCRVVAPETPDAVLLGTAMAAAVAGGLYCDLATAGTAMGSNGQERLPNAALRNLYDRDYQRFLTLYRHRAELEAME
ncbi:FGGY-family carbohydrate kinase [Sinorhizobium terangae]|uniref:FGGY-family carbohydrate kinase n=1 Tax=Sinorhizobium terangae TaxID=110322 RepID=UPI0024B1DA78|nr:FGGY-family carbohydrate kinase [Sinorhizobium terangae]WFU46715.1 FGGY-family carbohydrate kinase [Sinorhizobium terangae]